MKIGRKIDLGMLKTKNTMGLKTADASRPSEMRIPSNAPAGTAITNETTVSASVMRTFSQNSWLNAKENSVSNTWEAGGKSRPSTQPWVDAISQSANNHDNPSV
ncbi:hypothetical protein CDEF62S_04151 [Castellaniella defragrans]